MHMQHREGIPPIIPKHPIDNDKFVKYSLIELNHQSGT